MSSQPPSARISGLYQRALICRTFPAYKLDELRNTPAMEILQAMELLDLARQARE